MKAKATADVLLFVIHNESRCVASIAEVAYCLGTGQALALALADVGEGDRIDGRLLSASERDDLNRGRLFLRTMARQHDVPVFADVENAVQHAIRLVQSNHRRIGLEQLRAVLADVRFKDVDFLVEETGGGFLLQLCGQEEDVRSGARRTYFGRKWYIGHSATPSDIVRTAFKAAVTWQEHEAREEFTYQGARIFGPHYSLEDLMRLSSQDSEPSL